MREYPNFRNSGNLMELLDRLALVNDTRLEDIAQYNNLVGRIGTIRKVTKIPTSTADVDPDKDRPGDFNWDATGFYYLPSGALGWRFIASATF